MEISFDHLQLMAMSPDPGTNESIEYEDWNNIV